MFSSLIKLKKEGDFVWEPCHQYAFDQIKQYLTSPPIMMPAIPRRPLKLYISASQDTIGCLLAQDDENSVERAIYYLSRVLNDAELRYSAIEKLCLALYFSCTKLKYYMMPCNVYVVSKTDVIKYMLSKPILNGRIGKWTIALSEFSLQYLPAKAVKGQAIADFLVEHPGEEIPEINLVTLKPWKLFFDGSRHKNGIGVGILIINPQGNPTQFMFELKYSCSNNEVEYEALIVGLEILMNMKARNIEIYGDSQLII